MIHQLAFAYLIAYLVLLSGAAGALLLLAMALVTRARFFIGLRRLAEAVVGTLPLLALAFLPIYFLRAELYPWARPAELSEAARLIVDSRGAYHEAGPFLARSLGYLLVLVASGEALIYLSRRQDAGDPRATARLSIAAALSLPLASLALTFASFDWLMSLEPTWHSTMYGAYVFGGAMCAGTAVLVVALAVTRAKGLVPAELGRPHRQALGTLLLTFVIFWAYAAFCQYMLIWIADLPREVTYYRARAMGPYAPLAICLVLLHFALPFAALLPRAGREGEGSLLAAASLLLFAHYLDLHFLIGPVRAPEGLEVGLFDLLALPALGALSAAVARARFRRAAPVPRDPRLEECLRFEGVL